MCWGGSKTPDVAATPDPTPTPSPEQESSEVNASAESKRNKVSALRYGALGTIKNEGGAKGVSGQGIDLSNPSATGTKKTLGS